MPPHKAFSPSEPRLLLRALAFLQQHLPIGRGAAPRKIGAALVSDGEYYLTTKHGAKLALSPGSFDVYATMIRSGNTWDYEDFRICVDSVPSDGVFYEIGANVGYFAIEAATIKPSAKIYAFEPQTNLVDAINLSVEYNNLENLKVINALVGDEEGERVLYIAPASIHASAVEDSGRNPVGSIPKRMITIDGLIERGEIVPPDFVKMDVEGSEALVFKGATATFRTHMPNIFLEYLSEFDVGERVRKEVESLVSSSENYSLYGIPRANLREKYRGLFIPISEIGYRDVHGLYIRNISRIVGSATMF